MMVNLMEDLAERVVVEDLQPMPVARRKLVQSTLFPTSKTEQNSQTDDFRREEINDDTDEEEEEEEQEEEWASNGKKRIRNSSAKKKKTDSKHNPKTTPRPGAAAKKVAANRKYIPSMKVDEGVSPDKRTPSKLKEKKTKTTPKKKLVNGGQKEPMSKKSLSGILSAESTQQLIPNLRLEAKLIAEENSRMFAGRQVHPFFSSLKTCKKNQVIIDVENSFVEWKEPGFGFNPIHVFDTVEDQDKALFLDWGNWSLYDRSPLSNNSYDLGAGASSAYEVHVKPLQFDDIPRVDSPATASAFPCKISPNECQVKLNKDCPSDRNKASSTSMAMSDNWLGSNSLKSYSNQRENYLWTDKFHPKKAAQICGNSESVRFLTEWLSMWYEKGSQASKSTFHDNEEDAFGQDDDYCYQSDTDSEKLEEETSLKNVLLVTGPVGSGKSAAIYACAEEQGFQVIEVNTSDWRNGALVKQRFGEALESHWLQRNVESIANPGKTSSKSSSEIIEVTEGLETEFVPPSENLQLNYKISSKSAFGESRIHETQNATKTLILFEDVDVVLGDDHGFLSTIQQFSRTAKRPMILTANSNNPVLPSSLKRLEVSFGMPLSEELLGLGLFICEAESLKVHPRLMDMLVDSCQGDIRKTIIQLQFWCQGQSSKKGDESRITFGQYPFDLESGYHLLPKLIPWDCASQLSEIIEEEITKSLAIIEEHNISIKIAAEQLMDGKLHNNPRFDGAEVDCIDARKEAILSLHCSTPIKDDLSALPDCTHQASNSSESPVALFRRNVRRKIEAVVSSDSEEDNLGGSAGTNFVGAFCDETRTNKNEESSCCGPHVTMKGCYHQTDNFEGDKVEQACIECSENVTHPQTDGLCTSMDMSFVPESSFVPETEFDDKTVMYSSEVSCSILHKQEADSTIKKSPTNLPLIDLNNLFAGNQNTLASCSSIDSERIHGEEVGDSHLGHAEIDTRQNPMLDECSRIDFSGRVKNFKRLRSHQQIDSVQETWTRLRTCNIDLQQYVTIEEKDALLALKSVSGMSNIISEADLLLSSCQPHICDSVEPPLLPFEDSQLCSWYDNHLHMSSTTAQHGICFYTKKISALGSKRGSLNTLDLSWEMLFSSTDKMAFGKLLGLDGKIEDIGKAMSQICSSSLRRSREMDLSLRSMVRSLVPPRAYLCMRGGAFLEYLVSLTKISELESLRLSLSEQTAGRKQKRKRTARHYLNSGPCSLSLEDISLLSQYSCYRKSLPSLGIQALGKTSST